MFQSEERATLKKIHDLLEEAEGLFQTLSPEAKEYTDRFHAPKGTLPYCLRWGLTGVKELIEEENESFEVGTTYSVVKRIECESGYVPEGTTAKLDHIHKDLLMQEDQKPYQFDFNAFVSYPGVDEYDGYCIEMSTEEIADHLNRI